MNNIYSDASPEYEKPLPIETFDPRSTNIPLSGLKMTHTRELRNRVESWYQTQDLTRIAQTELWSLLDRIDYSTNNARAGAQSRIRELNRSLRNLTLLRETDREAFNTSTSMQNRQASEREDTIAQLNRLLAKAGDALEEKNKALNEVEKTCELQHLAIQTLERQLDVKGKHYYEAEKHVGALTDKVVRIEKDRDSAFDEYEKRLNDEKGLVSDLINQADARARDLADLRKKLRRRIEENGRLNEVILSMHGKSSAERQGYVVMEDIGPQEIAPDNVTEAQAREARETAAAVDREIKENTKPGPPRTLREDLNVKFPEGIENMHTFPPVSHEFPKPGQVQIMGEDSKPYWGSPPQPEQTWTSDWDVLQLAHSAGGDAKDVTARATTYREWIINNQTEVGQE